MYKFIDEPLAKVEEKMYINPAGALPSIVYCMRNVSFGLKAVVPKFFTGKARWVYAHHAPKSV